MKKAKPVTTVYKEESRLFYVALFTCLAVFVAYMYFVSASVMHVVMRKEVDSQIAEVGSMVSQLEAEYIEEQHLVSNEIAVQSGYVVADTKIFIDRTPTLVLSRN